MLVDHWDMGKLNEVFVDRIWTPSGDESKLKYE